MYGMHNGMHAGMHSGWEGWVPILAWRTVSWVVVIAVVAAGIALVMRARRSETDVRASAGDILAERYARGEIETDEYHARLAALR